MFGDLSILSLHLCLGHSPLDFPLCSAFHILGWALFFETFLVLYIVCPIIEPIHTILFDPPFPPLPLILWVSRSFLTENLWSYHHFLAVFTVIFWLFGFKVLSLVIGLTVLRAFHPPLGFSVPIGSSWWILFVLLSLGLLSLIPYFHCCVISSIHSLFEFPSFLLVVNLFCGCRSFLTEFLWSFIPLDISPPGFFRLLSVEDFP